MSARARGPRGRLARVAAIAALLFFGPLTPARAAAPPSAVAVAPDPRAVTPDLRPWDAPWIEGEPLTVPPLPPEYLTHEEAGFRLSYQPSTRDRVRSLQPLAAAIRTELNAQFGRPVLGAVEIRVAAAPSEMARLSPVEQLPATPLRSPSASRASSS